MTIVITGASRGIGAELAARYRAEGETVIGTSRKGGKGLVPLDLADTPDFSPVIEALGTAPIDLLVCNAGIYPDKGHDIATGFPPEDWAKALAVNITGPFLTIQALLPKLQASDKARIAIIASAMGSQERAPGGSYIYRASKAAAVNLARNLSRDLKSQGISVGAYHPGWVRTDMGGSGADISVDDSARGLIARFAELDAATTGCFRSYDGTDIPF